MVEILLRHDADTTRAVLDLATGLTDEQLDREFDIGHRSLRRTLAHVVRNMEVWYDLMAGRPNPGAPPQPGSDSIAALTARLDVVAPLVLELGLRVHAGQRAAETFTDVLADPPRPLPLGATLVHLATHGMHHRAQCLYLLRQLGVRHDLEGDALGWQQLHAARQTAD